MHYSSKRPKTEDVHVGLGALRLHTTIPRKKISDALSGAQRTYWSVRVHVLVSRPSSLGHAVAERKSTTAVIDASELQEILISENVQADRNALVGRADEE